MENATLNYRIIAFSFPEVKGAGGYVIEIVQKHVDEYRVFNREIKQVVNSKVNSIAVEVPMFGAKYTWRVSAILGGEKKESEYLYHFKIGQLPYTDTSKYRLRIIKEASKYADGYVFVDATRTLYDMKGNAVWFLPDDAAYNAGTLSVQDLKASDAGITFITGEGFPYEVDYNAKVRWTTWRPQSTNSDCHHELTKLSNGNYMTLGEEKLLWKLKGKEDSMVLDAVDSSRMLQQVTFGTIVEYDKNGKIIWRWRASEYFAKTDVHDHTDPYGRFDLTDHVNSFFFNRKESSIYLSCRDLNRILRISYPGGKVLNSYGKMDESRTPKQENELFSFQHSCRVKENGDLLLFNNNKCEECLPKLQVFAQLQGKNELIKKWEYEFMPQGPAPQKPIRRYGRGGNVLEMPDGSVFASFNMPNNLIAIIGANEDMLWGGLIEQKTDEIQEWQPMGTYRASFISGEYLHRILFSK